MQTCTRCGQPATHMATWPTTGATEPYCVACLDEYEATAQEIDAHEAQVMCEGLPGGYCPRPTTVPITAN